MKILLACSIIFNGAHRTLPHRSNRIYIAQVDLRISDDAPHTRTRTRACTQTTVV